MSIRSRLKNISKETNAPETGFGTLTNISRERFMNKDGSANVKRIGEPRFQLINIYHSLIMMSWGKFTLMVFISYVLVNLLFTAGYLLIGMEHIQGMIYQSWTDKFWETFFFSAQTLTTVGYGRLNPSGIPASTLAAFESLTGLMAFALATGLLYGKFSRPNARLIYSKNAIIAPYRHKKYEFKDMHALMFRIANARSNHLIETEAQLIFAYNQEKEGKVIRNFQILDLEISKVSYLSLSWTIVHPIDEGSPLYGLSEEDLLALDAEFLINMKAIDDGYSQQVYSRSSYKSDEVVWNARFVSAIKQIETGHTSVNLKMIDSYELI
jgi:inward rectifier potassium channel